MKTNCCK